MQDNLMNRINMLIFNNEKYVNRINSNKIKKVYEMQDVYQMLSSNEQKVFEGNLLKGGF